MNSSLSKEEVLGFEHPALVERLAKKESMLEKEANLLFKDTLRFLYLCAIPHDGALAPPERIDVAWHHFILFTKDYRQFCQANLRKFVEHVPNVNGGAPQKGADGFTPSERAIMLAKREFGELTPNWGRASDCIELPPAGECCSPESCQSN